MKYKTIESVIRRKVKAWSDTLPEDLRGRAVENVIVTGGCIPSMLLNETVSDYDFYFKDIDTCELLLKHYLGIMGVDSAVTGKILFVNLEGTEELRLGLSRSTDSISRIEDVAIRAKSNGDFSPVFLTNNAVTLTNCTQLVFRFYGSPSEIHKNYDFTHATSLWTHDGGLEINPDALQCIVEKSLRYQGSLYPLATLFRLRKFLTRGWSITAGELLKIALNIQNVDFTNPQLLQDQLMGVDVAFMFALISRIKEVEAEGGTLDHTTISEMIDEVFD